MNKKKAEEGKVTLNSKPTIFIQCWGHDLLLLPENIHLMKLNTSICVALLGQ